jgi:hypothetical protein
MIRQQKTGNEPATKKYFRFVVASRNIGMGETLISESAAILGPKTLHPDPVCLGCHYPLPVIGFRYVWVAASNGLNLGHCIYNYNIGGLLS